MDSFSAAGFFVQILDGPRKSGMPESVEMPAPVSTVRRVIPRAQPGRSARAAPASRSAAI